MTAALKQNSLIDKSSIMKKFFTLCAALAALSFASLNAQVINYDQIDSVVMQNQQIADQASQNFLDQAQSGGREVSRLENEIAESQKRIDLLKDEAKQINSNVKKLESVKKLKVESNKLQKKALSLDGLSREDKAAIKQMKKEEKAAQSDIDNEKAKLSKVDKAISANKKDISAAKKEISKIRKNIKSAEKDAKESEKVLKESKKLQKEIQETL